MEKSSTPYVKESVPIFNSPGLVKHKCRERTLRWGQQIYCLMHNYTFFLVKCEKPYIHLHIFDHLFRTSLPLQLLPVYILVLFNSIFVTFHCQAFHFRMVLHTTLSTDISRIHHTRHYHFFITFNLFMFD